MTVPEIQSALRSKKLSVTELVESFLSRIERYGMADGLNAVSSINERAIEQARIMDRSDSARDLPLFGLPILVKDNIDVAGMLTTAGSFALSDNLASNNAAVIDNIEKNGGIILGKTNMTEFANFTTQGMPGGYSSLGGQVKNAHDIKADVGGSSSGSAVAVAADLCAMAVGTDTSFSVVGCATLHGIVGMKPKMGVMPQGGIIPIAKTLDSAGMLTHSVRDALLLYAGMADRKLPDIQPIPIKNLKLAVNLHNKDMVSQAQLSLYSALFDRLKGTGTTIAEINQANTMYLKNIMLCEFREELEEYLCRSNASHKTLKDIVEAYEKAPEKMRRYGITTLKDALEHSKKQAIYREAMEARSQMQRTALNEISDYDACIVTGPTNIMNFTGIPSVSIPMCIGADGLPKSIILYGADEYRLYSAALTLEAFLEYREKKIVLV